MAKLGDRSDYSDPDETGLRSGKGGFPFMHRLVYGDINWRFWTATDEDDE